MLPAAKPFFWTMDKLFEGVRDGVAVFWSFPASVADAGYLHYLIVQVQPPTLHLVVIQPVLVRQILAYLIANKLVVDGGELVDSFMSLF